jgi:hypothetical protein
LNKTRLYVYKLTTDNGGAPCVYKGLLSLAICKPSIRRTAREGDWIFGFGGRRLTRRLIYIARVTKTVPDRVRNTLRNLSYYEDERYSGRPDRIYRRNGDGELVLRRGAKYHYKSDQRRRDIGELPSYRNAVALLSDDFRYFGRNGTAEYRATYRAVAALLDGLRRGHRVTTLSKEASGELVGLQAAVWRKYPSKMVLGRPTEENWTKPCNGAAGEGHGRK